MSHSITGFGHHRGTQLAASMSYYALFSVFPAALVITALAGFFLDDPTARQDAIDYLLEELPLSQEQGSSDIESVIDGVTSNSGAIGLIGLVTLLISASALMGAARNSISVIFGAEVRRGALRGKGIDLLLVVALGLIFSLSFAASIIKSLDIQLVGRLGDTVEAVLNATGDLLPFVLTALVFAVVYRVLPTERRAWRDVWPAVIFAAIGYEIVKRGFAYYLAKFADYSAIYGSLGTVIAFMFFVYLASIVFLIGAEMVAVWPAVRAGELDPDPDEEGEPFLVKLRSAALGLFRRNRVEKR